MATYDELEDRVAANRPHWVLVTWDLEKGGCHLLEVKADLLKVLSL